MKTSSVRSTAVGRSSGPARDSLIEAALYEVFAPVLARNVLRRLEFHFVPKHASWLNTRQYLPTVRTLVPSLSLHIIALA